MAALLVCAASRRRRQPHDDNNRGARRWPTRRARAARARRIERGRRGLLDRDLAAREPAPARQCAGGSEPPGPCLLKIEPFDEGALIVTPVDVQTVEEQSLLRRITHIIVSCDGLRAVAVGGLDEQGPVLWRLGSLNDTPIVEVLRPVMSTRVRSSCATARSTSCRRTRSRRCCCG